MLKMTEKPPNLSVDRETEETDYSDELYDELRSLIRGTLIRQKDTE